MVKLPEILFRSTSHYSTLAGDLLAEQLNDYLLKEVLGKDATLRPCYAKEPKVGAFLRENDVPKFVSIELIC